MKTRNDTMRSTGRKERRKADRPVIACNGFAYWQKRK